MLTPEELLADDRFVDWALSKGKHHDAYWQEWMKQEEGGRAVVDEACRLLLLLRTESAKVPDTDLAWKQLLEKLHEKTEPRPIWGWWKIAAAVALLVLASWLLWPQDTQYQTAFGEIRQLELPDGTIVDLRANSNLWWSGEWAENGVREVFLDGEAYFQVEPSTTQNGMAFVVQAAPLNVRVLGTSFNVVNRTQRAAVTLIEGKVEVKTTAAETAVLNPNQQYTWQPAAESGSVRTIADPKSYTSWRQQIWHFEQTPLREIAQHLQEDYGKTVVMKNAQLADKKLSGTAPAKSLTGLVNSIAASLGLQVEITTDQIVFFSRK